MKRTLKISLITLSALLILIALWFVFLRGGSTPRGEAPLSGSPFGSGDEFNVPTYPGSGVGMGGEGGEVGNSTETAVSITANLFQISQTPVAGTVIYSRGNSEVIRYADRATGHITEVVLPTNASSTTLEKTKITNTTLPKIYEAYFRPDGNAVLYRYLKNDSDVVENLSLTLTPPKITATSTPEDNLYTISSTLLRGEFGTVTVGAGNNLYYTLRDAEAVGSSAFNGSGARTILRTPFTDWRLVPAGNNLVAYTKASASAQGYAYLLNISNGSLTKILGPLNALAVVANPQGTRFLASYLEVNTARLTARDLEGKVIAEISPVTLAEKCVWSKLSIDKLICATPTGGVGGSEPDNWYRGLTHFVDDFWQFDTKTQVADLLLEPDKTYSIALDAFDLKLSPKEDYLIFNNKNDLSLWGLKLQ